MIGVHKNDVQFPDAGDPRCKHRGYYECVTCRKLVCARCGQVMPSAIASWQTIGYWCTECRESKGT